MEKIIKLFTITDTSHRGFDGLDKVVADAVFLHGCPQSCMPYTVEGLLGTYEDMVEVFLVLEIFLTQNLLVEDLLCGAPSCSEAAMIFSACGFNLFSTIFSMTLLGD